MLHLNHHQPRTRPVTRYGHHVPGNVRGPIQTAVPGIQLPAEVNAANEKQPIYPYNILTGFSVAQHPGLDAVAVGGAFHPINTLNLPLKELVPIWQAQQLQETSPGSFFPEAHIIEDRFQMLPGPKSRPLTPWFGFGAGIQDTTYNVLDVSIDFPLRWGSDRHRFQADFYFHENPVTPLQFKGSISFTPIGKKLPFYGEWFRTRRDQRQFHFGQSISPFNLLGLDVKRQFGQQPSWTPFINSIRANPHYLPASQSPTGTPLYVG